VQVRLRESDGDDRVVLLEKDAPAASATKAAPRRKAAKRK
jgi:hypothetical protein